MYRHQLQHKLSLEKFICKQCKKQISIHFNLITDDNHIYCYDCIKNNQNLIKNVINSTKYHYYRLFDKIPLPNIKIVQDFIQNLQTMRINSIKVIKQYKENINRFQQEIQQFYTETKIICTGYIDKMKLLVEKSQKSLDQLIKNTDIINQDKYIRNMKAKHKISFKMNQIVNKLKVEIPSIKQIKKIEENQIQRATICEVPIQSVIEIKGMLYYGTADGRIIYENSFNGQLKQIKAHDSLIRSLAYDGQNKLYSGSDDFKIKAWDLQDGELKFLGELGTVPSFKSYHRDIVVFNRGKTLASTRGQFDGFKIRIWQLNSFKNIRELQGHDNYIRAMTINNDEQLITVSDDRSLKIWNPKSSTCQRVFYHSKKLLNVFYNSQRDLIGIVDEDNRMMILDDHTLQVLNGWNIGRKILCSYGGGMIYFGVSSFVLVYDWNGVKINSFSLDMNFIPGVILQIGSNRVLICDGKGKSLEIPICRSLQV